MDSNIEYGENNVVLNRSDDNDNVIHNEGLRYIMLMIS